jgi:hypothetical protein
MAAGAANNSSGSYSQDCSICLNSIAVRTSLPAACQLPEVSDCPFSPVNASLSLLARTRGTISAFGPSSPLRLTRSSSVPTAAPQRTSRQKSKTPRSGSSLTPTKAPQRRRVPCCNLLQPISAVR